MTLQHNGEKPDAEAAAGGVAIGDAGDGRAPALPWSSGCSVRLLRDEDESAVRGKRSASQPVAQHGGRRRDGERGRCGRRALGPGLQGCGRPGRGRSASPEQRGAGQDQNGQTLALERCLRMQRGGWGSAVGDVIRTRGSVT